MLNEIPLMLRITNDALFTIGVDGRIVAWTELAARVYGYCSEEMTGKSALSFFADGRAGDLGEITGIVAKDGRVDRRETVQVAKDGSLFDVAINALAVPGDDGKVAGFVVAAQDISELKRAERTVSELHSAAQERSLVLETASRVALDILSSRAGVEALTHIADAARILAKAQYAALGVARPDGKGLIEFITVGLSPEQEHAIGSRPLGAGILGTLLHLTEPLRIEKLSTHSDSIGFPPNHPPMESFLGVPIRRGDLVLGSLYLTNKEGGGNFTKEDEIAVQAIGDHAAVAVHNLHMLSRQRALVHGLLNAQEEERRAIAYDLHDGLTQYVMASHIHLEAYKAAMSMNDSERAAREVTAGLKYMKQAVIESRRLVNGLRSLALDDLGLAGAVEQLVLEEKQRMGLEEIEYVHNIAYRRFDKTLETTAYRVVQEALTNVRKHAEANRVRIVTTFRTDPPTDRELITVEVRDWGNGFEPSEQSHTYDHLGLQGMAERVTLLGGKFSLTSSPGQGTHIIAVFPVLPTSPTMSEGR